MNKYSLLFSLGLVNMAQAACGGMMCAAIYNLDPNTCQCVPIEWMECHPQYNSKCNQWVTDEDKGRDPSKNPY